MIINKKYKFFFIHVPKTGGRSARYVLRRVEGSENLYRNFHSNISEAKEFFPENVYKNFHSFGFIRNPWSWIVSTFEIGKMFVVNEHYHGSHRKRCGITYEKGMGLPEYVSLFESGENPTPIDWLIREGAKVNIIYRLEDLEEIGKKDMKDLFGKEVKFPKINNRSTSEYVHYFSPSLKKKVEGIFYREIEIGRYKYD